jgi:23S rRNA (guanosine2251-2'-O)-methyltransferase
MKLNAQELRKTTLPDAEGVKQIKRNPIIIICDNVLDTYNVGAIFRLADAVAAQKVYLCGATETPPNSKIKKASVNTWAWVEWEYQPTALTAVGNLKSQNPMTKIIAVEQDKRSVPFSQAT